jgi:hypothetical protein
MSMNITRIIDGTVINIEKADQEWIDGQDDPAAFVAYTDDAPAIIGATWDGKAFTPPDRGPDPVAAAYERGKVDGAAEQVAAHAVAEAL